MAKGAFLEGDKKKERQFLAACLQGWIESDDGDTARREEGSTDEGGKLLPDLFNDSAIGLAVFDTHVRYRAIDPSLAAYAWNHG